MSDLGCSAKWQAAVSKTSFDWVVCDFRDGK